MSSSYRRYEILLPLKLNDGTPVPEGLISQTVHDLRREFGAVSCETQTIRGFWQEGERLFRDELVRFFVDVPDSAENRRFFVEYKERLKSRFQQLEIWLTTYLIEIL
jgi:hypothetical protein